MLDALKRRTPRMLRRLDGRSVTYVPASLPPFVLQGVIFERDYVLQDVGVGIDANQPALICPSDRVDNIAAHGDTIVIDDADLDGTPGTTTFKVVSIQPDGTGITTLILEEQ